MIYISINRIFLIDRWINNSLRCSISLGNNEYMMGEIDVLMYVM